MAVTPDDIRALEEAMRHFGIDGVTVDGYPSDLQDRLVPFLNALSRAMPPDADSGFGEGEEFTLNHLLDPDRRIGRIEGIEQSIHASLH